MAESPELLSGYGALWDLFSKSTLTPHEQQVVYLTSNFENDCHTAWPATRRWPACSRWRTQSSRRCALEATLPDPRLEALHRFTTTVVRERGFVPDADVGAFLAAGYTRRNVLEVVLGVATKVMSNYTNHIVHTPLDAFMKGNEWTKPIAAAP